MEREYYGVLYESGTCGAFICAIVNNLIKTEKHNIIIEQNGSIHNKIGDFCYPHKIASTHIPFTTCLFNHFIPNPNYKKYVLLDHTSPDYDSLFEQFSDFRVIIIDMNASDYWLYVFMKICKHKYFLTNLIKDKEYYISDNFEDYDTNTFKKIFDDLCLLDNRFFEPKTFITDSLYEKYNDKIVKLNFSEIIFDSNKTLKLLESITKANACEITYKNYNLYIDKQLELFDRYIPFMNCRQKLQKC